MRPPACQPSRVTGLRHSPLRMSHICRKPCCAAGGLSSAVSRAVLASASGAGSGSWLLAARLGAKRKQQAHRRTFEVPASAASSGLSFGWGGPAADVASAGAGASSAAREALADAAWSAPVGKIGAWCRCCEKRQRGALSRRCDACKDYWHISCLPASASTAEALAVKPFLCPVCDSSCQCAQLVAARRSSTSIGSRQQFVDDTVGKGPRCTWAREFTDAEATVLTQARLAQAQFQVVQADAAVEAAHADWQAAKSTGTSKGAVGAAGMMQVQAGPDPFGDPHSNRVLVHLPASAAVSGKGTGASRSGGGGAATRAVWLTPQEAADSRNSLPRGARRGLWDILNPQVLNSLRASGSDVESLRVDMWRQLSAVRQREECLA